jgi:hypothetical protein
MFAVVRGIRPARPNDEVGIGNDLWTLITQCWDATPSIRPGMKEVVQTVRADFADKHKNLNELDLITTAAGRYAWLRAALSKDLG